MVNVLQKNRFNLAAAVVAAIVIAGCASEAPKPAEPKPAAPAAQPAPEAKPAGRAIGITRAVTAMALNLKYPSPSKTSVPGTTFPWTRP